MLLPDLSELLREYMRVNVQKGAVWLDEYQPDWVSKILPDSLDLSDGQLCICGQVFGDYGARPDEVGEEPWAYGFTVDLEESPFRIFCDDLTTCGCDDVCSGYVPNFMNEKAWRFLDELWLDEIFWRCDSAA